MTLAEMEARLTPTRVGTTATCWPASRGLAAHPHTRGDDLAAECPAEAVVGSPPHAWGRHRAERLRVVKRGLTPTRVGTTTQRRRFSEIPGAHPHTRGDDRACARWHRRSLGSPPHAWGRRRYHYGNEGSRGLTPTRVGTTASTGTATLMSPAHPHTRGDDDVGGAEWVAEPGSPPHAWGRRLVPGDDRFGQRLTPTRVGTTSTRNRFMLRSPAHPHTRGDDRVPLMVILATHGSPPHAWGRRASSRPRRL